MVKEHLQITLRVIQRNQIWVFLCQSGKHYMILSLVKEEYLVGPAQKQAAKNGRRNADHKFGTNPCSEIILRDREFCNLSEVVVRESDTRETLLEKVRLATILGTIQSTLTNFKYVSAMWKNNCEEERLLGVSLTGIMDNELTNGKSGDTVKLLDELREEWQRQIKNMQKR